MFYFSTLGLWCSLLVFLASRSRHTFRYWVFLFLWDLALSFTITLGFLGICSVLPSWVFHFYTVATHVGLPIVLTASFPRVLFTSSIFTFLQLTAGPYTSYLYDVC